MKHIGWCLERIQIAMADIPKEVTSPEDKLKANMVLDEVQQYADTLVELILNPKFKDDIHKLEHASIEGIRLQAQHVEELFRDLEHMLYVLDTYIKHLRDIIRNNPEQWNRKADQIVLMIDQKFGGEMGELRKEFQIALYELEQLRQIVTSEEHLAEFLK